MATGSEHDRSCNIFTGGHDKAGTFHPAPCDCHLSETEAD